MANTRTQYHHLRNNLSKHTISDDEYMRMSARFGHYQNDTKKQKKITRIAKITGYAFLALVSLFILQQFVFPAGPNITSVLRIIPSAGTLVVIVIAWALIYSARKKNRLNDSFLNNNEPFDKKETPYEPQKQSTQSPGLEDYACRNQKKLFRSRHEKMFLGVCGGIAERFQIDPTIVRAIFALAFLSYGFSLLIYIIMALVIPQRPVEPLIQ